MFLAYFCMVAHIADFVIWSRIWVQCQISKCDTSETQTVPVMQRNESNLHSWLRQRPDDHQKARPLLLHMWLPRSLLGWSEGRCQGRFWRRCTNSKPHCSSAKHIPTNCGSVSISIAISVWQQEQCSVPPLFQAPPLGLSVSHGHVNSCIISFLITLLIAFMLHHPHLVCFIRLKYIS